MTVVFLSVIGQPRKRRDPGPQGVVPPCRRGGGGRVVLLIQNLVNLEEPIQKRINYFRIFA